MEYNLRKKNIEIYSLAQFAIEQKLTEHCKSTIIKNKKIKIKILTQFYTSLSIYCYQRYGAIVPMFTVYT